MKCAAAIAWFIAVSAAGFQSPGPLLDREPVESREPKKVPWLPVRVAARGVHIAYAGATRAPAGVKRSREEARELAAALAIQARSQGEDIGALAAKWSDDPAGRARGGFFGTVRIRKDQTALERAMLKVPLGAIVGPVETPEGFFVAERIPVEDLAYDAIVIAWRGVEGASKVIRSQSEALARADEIAARVRSDPTSFDAVVHAESDDRVSAERGGAIAPAPLGELDPRLEDALHALEVGGVGGPVETNRGYLVVRRAPVDRVTADLVLVAYRGAAQAPLTQVRSKEDARARAEEILQALRQPNTDVGEIAKVASDDLTAPVNGPRRTMAISKASTPFARELMTMPIGEWRILESPLGFYIVRRVALEPD